MSWGLNDIEDDLVNQGNNEDITVGEGTTAKEEIPVVKIDNYTRRRIIQPWKNCLIVKVVVKTVGYKYISIKTRELRNPSGTEKEGESYGPWMLVSNKQSKVHVKGRKAGNVKVSVNVGEQGKSNRESGDGQWQVVSKHKGKGYNTAKSGFDIGMVQSKQSQDVWNFSPNGQRSSTVKNVKNTGSKSKQPDSFKFLRKDNVNAFSVLGIEGLNSGVLNENDSGNIVTPMKGINSAHNGVVNGDNGAVIKTMKGDYKKKNKAQMIHSNIEQDEQSKKATEFIFSSLSKSACGRMDGGGPSGEKST